MSEGSSSTPSTTARWKCPKCSNEDRRKIQERDDKTKKPLYYTMSGSPAYQKLLHCGICGNDWPKPA